MNKPELIKHRVHKSLIQNGEKRPVKMMFEGIKNYKPFIAPEEESTSARGIPPAFWAEKITRSLLGVSGGRMPLNQEYVDNAYRSTPNLASHELVVPARRRNSQGRFAPPMNFSAAA